MRLWRGRGNVSAAPRRSPRGGAIGHNDLTMRALFFVAGSLIFAAACATGGGEGGDDDGSSSSSTSASSGAAGGSSSSGSSTSSSSSGDPPCEQPNHLCGGICVGNTVETGCHQSPDCQACPAPMHGTPSCTDDGYCDLSCAAPYEKMGISCVCPMECCTDADCSGSDEVCDNNTCIVPCDATECFLICELLMQVGGCVNNMCTCAP
jgi:hypothetical protein